MGACPKPYAKTGDAGKCRSAHIIALAAGPIDFDLESFSRRESAPKADGTASRGGGIVSLCDGVTADVLIVAAGVAAIPIASL
jgi:hypothetical protein